ncbi:MAG TPA: MobF family relaxase [Acidimicrobiales bacterium]|nr:MobF family relaxase [Acidimicrobiales bacterium]
MTGLTDAEYVISSVALSIDEYYAGVGESPGVWSGKWAEKLGLVGMVEADQLRSLVEGRGPTTGEELLQGSRPRSVKAFDLTFSCPKSVSLLWAFGTDAVAGVVAEAHREAVEVALGFLEERAAAARAQSHGLRRRVGTEGWAVAGFVHRTSREGDPQLHTHCVVPNIVQRKIDGRYVAFDAGPLFDWCRAAGSIYQAELQRCLSLRLGVEWGPDRNNTRELLGPSREQLRAFSKRSVQIEAELEAKGARYEPAALRMQADDEASLATRTPKDHSLTPALLQGRWRDEAAAVGLATGRGLENALCWRGQALGPPGWQDVAAALVDPETGLCSRSARFSEADVVEGICALSGGRLGADEVLALADRFLASDAVVRLTPDADEGRRRPAQWSTATHRATEDRTVALIGTLSGRHVPALEGEAVAAALAAAPKLGEDQVAAVRVLAGEGASLRAVLAPAGYGKTTMLHTAAQAATAGGRPVLAVATTAKAVAELAGAGLDARTIARLRIDLADGPLAAGTVVVLDEVSQTPTHEFEAVLAGVDACPGGSLWVLGDPRQSQPVGAGGVAAHIEALAADGSVPAARLTVNRRQVDSVDREALGLLRQGDAAGSQALRTEHGWEHDHSSPAAAREAMAAAVCDDIGRYGAEQVAVLVVSHTDAEDLADRLRARLAASGQLSGTVLAGPGWTSEREYQAGDRVLLHARCGASGSPLVNGTTATVTGVDGHGLAVRLDGSGKAAALPASFVQGARKDGSPNLSHAWARTVDGAQGGTWEACHLMGSPALDAYRGYTGQSRSRQPTHTWNTARLVPADHGGALAEQRGPAELVAEALGREPERTLAARSDPWVLDRQLRDQVAGHETVLATRPADRRQALVAAAQELQAAESWLANMDAVASQTARQLRDMGPFAGLSRRGRDHRRLVQEKLAIATEQSSAARDRRHETAGRVERLRHEQEALEQFEAAEGWRRDDIPRLQGELDHHWADVVAQCARADDPLAFGVDKLRHARATFAAELQRLVKEAPVDRGEETEQVHAHLTDAIKERHDAERALADSRSRPQDASRRRWGHRDRAAVACAKEELVSAEERLEKGVAAERDLRDHLAAIARDQEARREAVSGTAPKRKELETALAQLDAALDCTRPDRVVALADAPLPHLVERLGLPPGSSAGRAVWCHYALGIEATLDRNDGRSPHWTGLSQQMQAAKKQIAVADQLLETSIELEPAEWANLALEAANLRERVHRSAALRQVAHQLLTARARQPQWSAGSHGWVPEDGQGPSL